MLQHALTFFFKEKLQPHADIPRRSSFICVCVFFSLPTPDLSPAITALYDWCRRGFLLFCSRTSCVYNTEHCPKLARRGRSQEKHLQISDTGGCCCFFLIVSYRRQVKPLLDNRSDSPLPPPDCKVSRWSRASVAGLKTTGGSVLE